MLTIAFKELRLFFKDKKALLLTFITPIGLITLLVFAFGGNSKETKFDPIKLPVCDLDESADSKKFISELKKIALAAQTPSVSISPNKKLMLFMEKPSLPSIEEFSNPNSTT